MNARITNGMIDAHYASRPVSAEKYMEVEEHVPAWSGEEVIKKAISTCVAWIIETDMVNWGTKVTKLVKRK